MVAREDGGECMAGGPYLGQMGSLGRWVHEEEEVVVGLRDDRCRDELSFSAWYLFGNSNNNNRACKGL